MENNNKDTNSFSRVGLIKTKISTGWIDNTITYLIYALIFLIPIFFLPIFSFSLGAAKEILAVALVLTATGFWLVKVMIEGKLSFINTWLNKILLIFIVLTGISSLLSFSPYNSITFGSSSAFLTIFAISALAFWLITVNFNLSKVIFAYFILIISLSLLNIMGLLTAFNILFIPGVSFTAFFNPMGSFNNLGVAVALNILLITGFLSFSSFNYYWLQILARIFMIISFATLVIVNYWWLWIIFIISLIFILALKFAHDGENIDRKSLILPLILVFISLFFILTKYSIMQGPMSVFLTLDKTFELTGSVFKDSVKNIFFGFGPGAFENAFHLYKGAIFNKESLWNISFISGWSIWFSNILTLGILGSISLLAFLISATYKNLNAFLKSWSQSKSPRGLIGMLAGINSVIIFFILGGFLNLTYGLSFMLILFIVLALGIVSRSHLYNGDDIKTIDLLHPPQRSLISLLALIFLLMVVVALLYFEGRRVLSNIVFSNGINQINQAKLVEDVDQGLIKIIKASNYDRFNSTYLQNILIGFRLRAQLTLQNNETEKDQKVQELQDIINSAQSLQVNLEKINSKNVLDWISLGNFYESFIPVLNESNILATKFYLKGQEFSPYNPLILASIARANIALFDALPSSTKNKNKILDNALNQLEETLKLKANYDLAYFLRAQIYERKNDLDKALENALVAQFLSPKDTGLVFEVGKLYYKTDDFNRAEDNLKSVLSLTPNHSNARYLLALIYEKQGKITLARGHLEEILKLNPENEEIKSFLSRISKKTKSVDKESKE